MPNDLASKRLLIYAESVGRISRCPFVVRYKHPVHSVSPFVSRLYIYAGLYNWFVIGQGPADQPAFESFQNVYSAFEWWSFTDVGSLRG